MAGGFCGKCSRRVKASKPGSTLCHPCFVEMDRRERQAYGEKENDWSENNYLAIRYGDKE